MDDASVVPAAADRRSGSIRRSLLLASGAFVLYGGWAFLANRSHGTDEGLQALLVQGTMSFVSTLTITMLMELAFGRTGAPWLRLVRAIAAGVVTMYVLTISVHLALGTPELVATVAPVLAVGTAYCVIYCVGLQRLLRAA